MSGSKKPMPKKPDQEDVFQAVLLADNFEKYLLGENCPFVPEGFITLANRKLIDYSLEALTASGVHEIFVYSSRNCLELKNYIESNWSKLPQTISVLTSEDSMSLGDALRDMDKKAVLRNDFILMQAGVVTNIQLRPLLDKHRETVKADKGAVMTLVHRKMSPGHRSRSTHENSVVVVDNKTNKILAYHFKLPGKKLTIPLENMQPEMDLYLDTCDTGIAICSSCVPPLFVDNFDFYDMNDLIRGILINEEIMGNSLYLHRIEEGYANRVVDFNTYKGICTDVLQRWTYPLVPDMPFGGGPELAIYPFNYNFTYKGNNIKIGPHGAIVPLALIGHESEIGSNTNITNSCIGDKCKIGMNVKITNSVIGDNVIIEDHCLIEECIITDNTILLKGTELKPWYLVDGKNRSRIELPTAEEPDGSDTSDDDPNGPYDLPEDTGDFERFSTEVLESLHRGVNEHVATENLILEINSSKYAYNITFKEVTIAVTKAVLILPGKLDPQFDSVPFKTQWEKTKECITKFKSLFQHYVKTLETQHDLLNALEEYADDNPYFRPILMLALHFLYDEDILFEDAILEWHKNESLYDAGVELRSLVSKFIEWLQVAESEDEDD